MWGTAAFGRPREQSSSSKTYTLELVKQRLSARWGTDHPWPTDVFLILFFRFLAVFYFASG